MATMARAQDTSSSAREQTTTPNNGPNNGEIIVTGRGRSEQLQSAPVSVTAFSAKALADAQVQDVADYISLAPNVSIVEAQQAGLSFITIRGISQVRNGESPVAVVTDGIQQVTSRQFTQDPFDVAQIEILRGPQGALYGRNAIGGAIIVTTKQPTNAFHESFAASYGNGSDYRIQGAVSGPIVKDKILFRLSGSYRNFGGLLDNIYLDKTADRVKDGSVKGQIKVFLTDDLTLDLNGHYDHTAGGANNYQYQPAKLIAGTCFLDTSDPFGGGAPDAGSVSRTYCSNNRGTNTRMIVDGSAKLTYTADWGTITNSIAAAHVREYIGSDQFPYTASASPAGLGIDGTQTQYENLSAWQDEFRIASPDHGRFKWMVGAYYLRTDRFISSTTGLDTGTGITEIRHMPQYNAASNPTQTFLADNNHNDAYAFFGNISYEITNRLELSAAYRFDHDHRHQIISPYSSAGLPAGCTTDSTAACNQKTNFSKSQPKVTLSYKPSRNLTLFADWGIGFRSGQYNQSGAAEAANFPGVYDLTKPETAYTSEAGFKATLLGGRMHVNATGFYTRDKNSFYFVFVGAVGAQILVNIDKSDLYGGEIEADFTPFKGLTLFGNYGYTQSKIKNFAYDQSDVGNKAPYVPEDSGLVGAQYRFSLNDHLGVFSRAEMEHHGKQYWEPENSTARPAFNLVNLQLGLERPGSGWSLTGFVRNLADKKYNAEFVSGGFVQPAEPRTYGIQLRTDF